MIYITTALACEAKPLISHYRLKKLTSHNAFPCYLNDDICLIVSGMGRVAMAAATAYLGAIEGDCEVNGSWINVGIAGHSRYALGTAVLADKVVEQGTKKVWYPVFTFSPKECTTCLMTLDTPETSYHDDCMYDMEGSAFIETASRFTSFESIQLFKVISDNAHSGFDHINKNYVSDLLGAHLSAIDDLVHRLRDVQAKLDDGVNDDEDYTRLLETANFSFSQQLKLRRLLQRYSSLESEQRVCENLDLSSPSAKVILSELERLVVDLALTKS